MKRTEFLRLLAASILAPSALLRERAEPPAELPYMPKLYSSVITNSYLTDKDTWYLISDGEEVRRRVEKQLAHAMRYSMDAQTFREVVRNG